MTLAFGSAKMNVRDLYTSQLHLNKDSFLYILTYQNLNLILFIQIKVILNFYMMETLRHI